MQGFHRTYATGAACQQRTLTPPDTWSCPTLGLACVLMSRPISPELVLSPDLWISNTPRYFSFALYSMNWLNYVGRSEKKLFYANSWATFNMNSQCYFTRYISYYTRFLFSFLSSDIESFYHVLSYLCLLLTTKYFWYVVQLVSIQCQSQTSIKYFDQTDILPTLSLQLWLGAVSKQNLESTEGHSKSTVL